MSNPRNRNLLIIIGVLLLTNIAVLVYFLGQKKSDKPAAGHSEKSRSGIAEMLQKEVGFSDEQTEQYKQMREKQREILKPMYDGMRKAKDSLFKLLSHPETSDSVVNNTADIIAQKQKAIDIQTLNYFKKVRTLCLPQQLVQYDSVILRMFSKMGRPSHHTESEKKDKQK